MQIKTSELQGVALDWAVMICKGKPFYSNPSSRYYTSPSTNWAQGGPIIEREISRLEDLGDDGWEACGFGFVGYGYSPLVAAMRCYVAIKLGDTVEVPDELIGG